MMPGFALYVQRAHAEHRRPSRTELKAQAGEQNRLAAVTFPMPQPRHINWREWKRYKGIPVAPAEVIHYDPLKGGKWNA